MAEIIKALPNSILLTLTIAIILILVGLAIGLFFLIKSVLCKGKLKVKIGNNEIGLNSSDESSNKQQSVKEQQNLDINTSSLNKVSFISVISNIINYSTDMSYEATAMRQSLYTDQVRNAKAKFNMVKTIIIGDYIKGLDNISVEFIDLVLESLIDNTIMMKLEKAFQADRFAEKTKDRVLEANKSFIESAFSDFKLNLIKFINNLNDNKDMLIINKKIITCVDNQKDLIKKSIIECFEYAYSEAVNYVKKLTDLSARYSAHINNALRSYITDIPDIVNNLPEIWNETMPPNSVVGRLNV